MQCLKYYNLRSKILNQLYLGIKKDKEIKYVYRKGIQSLGANEFTLAIQLGQFLVFFRPNLTNMY
jgi:hypothetical protein